VGSIVTVSSKGQVVLPVELRDRLGLSAGAKLEVLAEADGLHLKIVRSVPRTDLDRLAGMVRARSKGRPRRLQDFDAASLAGAGRK
jgi:AbrB family looped-hinge helix DNA binding protein